MKEDQVRKCCKCNSPFHPKRDIQDYCSRKCSNACNNLNLKASRWRSYRFLSRRAAKIDPGNALPNF